MGNERDKVTEKKKTEETNTGLDIKKKEWDVHLREKDVTETQRILNKKKNGDE